MSYRGRLAVMSLVACTALVGLASRGVRAADHSDMPQNVLNEIIVRPDASITDFWAFVEGRDLVMIMGLNPLLSPEVTRYEFPSDVRYTFHVDNDSRVRIDDSVISREFGGVIEDASAIEEDIAFEITFTKKRGRPRLEVRGARRLGARLFAGLRAEAFIFAPFVRNNIAGIVVQVPLRRVVGRQPELILWATAEVDAPNGPFVDLGGRALRSQFGPSLELNALDPSEHLAAGFDPADVVILDTSLPTTFPNGRFLEDDVVDIVAGFVSLPTDGNAAAGEVANCSEGGNFFPCPVEPSATADDIRIQRRFPYLGRPYRP